MRYGKIKREGEAEGVGPFDAIIIIVASMLAYEEGYNLLGNILEKV